MSRPQTVKTRILIISDTHTAALAPAASDADGRHGGRAFRQPLPAADVLLHCGDLTMQGQLAEYEGALQMLGSIDAGLKLAIAGNHDISLDAAFYGGESKRPAGLSNGRRMHMKRWDEQMPDDARRMWTGKGGLAEQAGVTYLEEGVHAFVLGNGARLTVYASPYQPEFCNWAFAYERHEDRFNPPELSAPDALNIAVRPVPAQAHVLAAEREDRIDVVMTHGPPYKRLDHTYSGMDVGCTHLLRAMARARPRLHCFGHIHEGWGAERVTWSGGGHGESAEDGGGVAGVQRVPVDRAEAVERRAAYVDVGAGSREPLRVGEETLMVNASIMDLGYKPSNAPWLVDVDLPRAEG